MGNLVKYGLIVAVVGYFFYTSQSNDSGNSYVEDDIDLNIVLDITVDTLDGFQQKLDQQKVADQTSPDDDQVFIELAEALGDNYNKAQPKLIESQIGVSPQAELFSARLCGYQS